MQPATMAATTTTAIRIFSHFFAFLLLGGLNFFFGSVPDAGASCTALVSFVISSIQITPLFLLCGSGLCAHAPPHNL